MELEQVRMCISKFRVLLSEKVRLYTPEGKAIYYPDLATTPFGRVLENLDRGFYHVEKGSTHLTST